MVTWNRGQRKNLSSKMKIKMQTFLFLLISSKPPRLEVSVSEKLLKPSCATEPAPQRLGQGLCASCFFFLRLCLQVQAGFRGEGKLQVWQWNECRGCL